MYYSSTISSKSIGHKKFLEHFVEKFGDENKNYDALYIESKTLESNYWFLDILHVLS